MQRGHGCGLWSGAKSITCHAVWLKKNHKTPKPHRTSDLLLVEAKRAVMTSPPFILLYSMQILLVGFIFLESFFPCPLVSLWMPSDSSGLDSSFVLLEIFPNLPLANGSQTWLTAGTVQWSLWEDHPLSSILAHSDSFIWDGALDTCWSLFKNNPVWACDFTSLWLGLLV